MNYRTKILHSGKDRDPHTGASSIPIYQVSTFAQDDPFEFGPYEYARGKNPTREALEHTVASLESGKMGYAFASGMAAISSVLLLFKSGDHIIVAEDVYGGTYRALNTLFNRWGLKHTFVDMTDPDRIERALLPGTKAIFAETPSNPLLKITDIRAVADIAKKRGLLTIIDNTFMSPYFQRPLELGFDIVIHSATKFLGGHSDLIAGLVVAADRTTGKKIQSIQNTFGAILGPQDSWLVLRGIKTLSARMEAQERNAETIAQWLLDQPEVKAVYYPTLPSHPGREIHLSQASGGGAVVSFDLGSRKITKHVLRNVKVPLMAVSLGGVESILSYPATMSHAAMPEPERHARGITDGLVRLSVGLEDPGDLCKDLAQAIRGAYK
ncbi:MAG TPA: aminotransferase class I/II-fold pyridoxal phosphate-dependent enzyme [Syntrophorhabdaceae bacterium]|nr:aminotransferase class I/II-fold pyridoxal phosphate-dependent enzyme [Syntrophorhabdaceae bacterium]